MVLVGKKGYFFVVDAIIAAIILLFGLFYLFGSQVSNPDQSQTYTSTEDYARIMLSTSLATSQNDYYRTKLLPQNLVPYPDATPFEEIGYLLLVDPTACPSCQSHAMNFSMAIMNESLENRYGAAVYFNNTLVYNRSVPKQAVVINRSVIVYVRMDAMDLRGPVRGDVLVWY